MIQVLLSPSLLYVSLSFRIRYPRKVDGFSLSFFLLFIGKQLLFRNIFVFSSVPPVASRRLLLVQWSVF